jgi:hypothetical protein
MEVPRCPDPDHAGGRVVRAGWYGRSPHRRQRWLCRPVSGEAHRFTEALPRREADRSVCCSCFTQLEPWEGQPGPRTYSFTAREIAHLLVRVAEGSTYRSAAQAVRRLAGRPEAGQEVTPGRRRSLSEGQLAAKLGRLLRRCGHAERFSAGVAGDRCARLGRLRGRLGRERGPALPGAGRGRPRAPRRAPEGRAAGTGAAEEPGRVEGVPEASAGCARGRGQRHGQRDRPRPRRAVPEGGAPLVRVPPQAQRGERASRVGARGPGSHRHPGARLRLHGGAQLPSLRARREAGDRLGARLRGSAQVARPPRPVDRRPGQHKDPHRPQLDRRLRSHTRPSLAAARRPHRTDDEPRPAQTPTRPDGRRHQRRGGRADLDRADTRSPARRQWSRPAQRCADDPRGRSSLLGPPRGSKPTPPIRRAAVGLPSALAPPPGPHDGPT